MKITTKHIIYDAAMQTCKNCGHIFKGKICNQCGEKIFSETQLTTKHFFHQILDFFWHWESKVIKSIKLNFFKPGFITKENINGIRVPYAKPIQLYLVVAFLFYIIVSKVGVTDYIPSFGDHYFYTLSDYKLLKWAKPIDEWAVNSIDSLWVKKGRSLENGIQKTLNNDFVRNDSLVLMGRKNLDSVGLQIEKMPIISYRQMVELRQHAYNASVGAFSKTFIFVLLPFFAGLFFLLFFKKIKYYGASLIFATHFMIYNLCIYSLAVLINLLPNIFTNNFKGSFIMYPFNAILYNEKIASFSEVIFGGPFEFFHLAFWMPWLYIAFKKLFNTPWWKNLFIAYICIRVFFFLIFGVLKKLLIAFTIWTIHA